MNELKDYYFEHQIETCTLLKLLLNRIISKVIVHLVTVQFFKLLEILEIKDNS